jgi:hypothetical protein
VFRFLQRWWIVCVSRYVENGLKQDLFDKLRLAAVLVPQQEPLGRPRVSA